MKHETRAKVATLTLSDTRTEDDDEGGKLLRRLIEAGGHEVVRHAIVREDEVSLGKAFEGALGLADIEVLVSTGGTGIGPRDRAIEVASPLIEKELTGFGEAFRRLSWEQVGARSVLSRALAGTARGKLLVLLPGSPKAVELAVTQVLLPIMGHAVDLLAGRTAHRRV